MFWCCRMTCPTFTHWPFRITKSSDDVMLKSTAFPCGSSAPQQGKSGSCGTSSHLVGLTAVSSRPARRWPAARPPPMAHGVWTKLFTGNGQLVSLYQVVASVGQVVAP